MAKSPSPYQLHVLDWRDCKRCDLSKTRQNVAIYRGKVPCDVLMVGEAPGDSEDVLGKPFKGPAGKLLDDIISNSLSEETRVGITNAVGCIPYDEEGQKLPRPPKFAIEECLPRLKQIVAIANPRLIVSVGETATKALWFVYRNPLVVPIIHPAALLRMNTAQFGLEVQRAVIVIRDGWRKVQESKNASAEDQRKCINCEYEPAKDDGTTLAGDCCPDGDPHRYAGQSRWPTKWTQEQLLGDDSEIPL